MDSLYIIIPAYNEEENIAGIIDEWYSIVERHNGNGKSRLVVIDDGSRDSTLQIMEQEREKREYLEIISKENGGHGSSIYCGYQYALKSGADYIFQTDSDGQTLASEFEAFWEDRENYDVIIGNRIHRGDGLSRRIVSLIVRLVVLLIFHVSVEDTNTPYRLMRHDSLNGALKYIPKDFNLTNIALTGIFANMARKKKPYEIRLKFVPITFRPRQGGVNSINVIKIIKVGIKAFSDLIIIKRNLGSN